MKTQSYLDLAVLASLVTPLLAACSAGGASESSGTSGHAAAAAVGSGGSDSGMGGSGNGTGGNLLDIQVSGGGISDQDCSVAILGDPGENQAANFASWIEARGPVVDRFKVGPDLAALTAATLADYQIVLLDWLPLETQLGIAPQELDGWVRGGGRLIALSGYADNDEALAVQNQMLQPLELGFATDQVLWGPVEQFAAHAITRELTSVSFIGGREVIHAADDTVVMTVGAPPTAVGVVAERGSGRAFLFGDEWITFDSEWSMIPEIQQLWVNVFDWLGSCKLKVIVT